MKLFWCVFEGLKGMANIILQLIRALQVCTFCSHESIILYDKVNVVLPVLVCSRRNMTLTTDYPRPVPSGVT